MKDMRHLGWKVLRLHLGSKRTSTFAATGALEYPKGVRRTPLSGCGPITLFRKWGQAYKFTSLLASDVTQIVPVRYTPWVAKEALEYALWQPWAGKWPCKGNPTGRR